MIIEHFSSRLFTLGGSSAPTAAELAYPISSAQALEFLLNPAYGMINTTDLSANAGNVLTFGALASTASKACPASPACGSVLTKFYTLYPSFNVGDNTATLVRIGQLAKYFFSDPALSQAAIGYKSANVNGRGSGLLLTRTVAQWTFGVPDLLLGGASVGFFSNATNEEATLAKRDNYDTVQTGKYNRSLIGQFSKVGDATGNNVYPKHVDYRGTDGSKFKMNVKSTDPLEALVTQLARPFKLKGDKTKVDIAGIPTYHFGMDPEENKVNPDYLMSSEGLFNASTVPANSGLPFVFTRSKFLGCDANLKLAETWGVSPTADDDVGVWVEPYTGRTLKGHLRLQLNFAIPASSFNYYNALTWPTAAGGNNQLMPLLIADEYGEITPSDADKLKNIFKKIKIATAAVTAILIILGGILLVVGGLLCSKALKAENSASTTPAGELQEMPAAKKRQAF